MLQRAHRHGPTGQQGWRGLCRPAMLGGVHRRRPCGVGPAVRAAGRAAGQPGGLAVPRRHRPVAPVASGRARRRRARTRSWSRAPAGGRWRCPGWCRTTSSSPCCQERVFPVGNFIRLARAARLSRGARLLPRLFGHIPMLAHHDFAEMVEHVGRLGTAAIAAGEGDRVARIYWHSVEFGLAPREAASSRSSAPASPRASARRISAWKAKTSSGCPSRSSGRSTRRTSTTPSSRATWSRNRSSGRSPRCWR